MICEHCGRQPNVKVFLKGGKTVTVCWKCYHDLYKNSGQVESYEVVK